jgi:hypothetical protein
MILFDRLDYVDRLKQAGISDGHARAHVVATDIALREALMTVLRALRLAGDMAQVKEMLGKMEIELRPKVRLESNLPNLDRSGA